MAFRADEAARAGYEEAMSYLVPRHADEHQRRLSKAALEEILPELGPAVDSYPSWHPLVCNHDDHNTETTPSDRCGYKGLDHTRFFVNGFITCPYGDGQNVLDSVAALPHNNAAQIRAKKLDVQLYNPEATPILITCFWEKQLATDGTIPSSLAVPLILEKELPCWHWAQVAEPWESMRSYFLGRPHGSRSSLFLNQETGQAVKKIWEALIHTGMFGPTRKQ